MTDERSKLADEAWVDALEGRSVDDVDVDDARLIRATIEAHDALSMERISDEQLDAAKKKLIARLGAEDDGTTGDGGAAETQTKVVDLSTRRPEKARRSVWQQNPAMLLAASVAFVAIMVMVLRNPDIPDGPVEILAYGEVDTLRGSSGESVLRVENPDAFGRELGARLIEREIPFVLTAATPDSPDRFISIQVDGVANVTGVQDTLDELGLDRPSTSVLAVRLVANGNDETD